MAKNDKNLAVSSGPEIVNRTHFRTDDLRSFVTAGLRAKNAEGLVKTVEFRLSPTSYLEDGKFVVEDKRIFIRIPRGWMSKDLVHIAQIFDHEVDHALGLEHSDMPMPEWYNLEVPWARGLKFRKRKGVPDNRRAEAIERRIRRLMIDLAWVKQPQQIETRYSNAPRRTRRE